MSKVFVAPTGRLSQGHVLDVAIKPFTRALQDLDKQLYVKWNPKKRQGWGCWEIRRKPSHLSLVDLFEFDGFAIIKLGYQENNFVNHIKDCEFLNYDLIRYLKTIDTWAEGRPADWAQRLEQREAEYNAKVRKEAAENTAYMGKQYKTQIRAFKEFVLSGGNPAEIASYWDKIK